jgi:hypothetical protein
MTYNSFFLLEAAKIFDDGCNFHICCVVLGFRSINCTFFHFSHYLNFFSLRIRLELMLDSRYVLLGVQMMFNFLRHKTLETFAEN